jgi:hypothetical protein
MKLKQGDAEVIFQPTKTEDLIFIGNVASPFTETGCLLHLSDDAKLEVMLLEDSIFRIYDFVKGWNIEQIKSVKNSEGFALINFAGQ